MSKKRKTGDSMVGRQDADRHARIYEKLLNAQVEPAATQNDVVLDWQVAIDDVLNSNAACALAVVSASIPNCGNETHNLPVPMPNLFRNGSVSKLIEI